MNKKLLTIALFGTPIIVGCGVIPANIATPASTLPTITNTAPAEWLTPPSEVLLLYDPDNKNPVPPPATFTAIVANRIFSFTNPAGFKFLNTPDSSLMMDEERELLINLQLMEHKGKANSIDAIIKYMEMEKLTQTSKPEELEIDGYNGWIVNVENSSYFSNSNGQVFAIDIDPTHIFYGLLVAGKNGVGLENGGLEIFDKVINSIQFNTP